MEETNNPESSDISLYENTTVYDADEMENITTGKVVLNLHTIQDSVWEFEKNFK